MDNVTSADPTPALPAVAAPDPLVLDSVLDQVVQEIGQLVRAAPLQLAHDIGKIIIERIYDGDFSSWRSRGHKETSFKKLARRQDLPEGVNAVSLYRSVSVYEIVHRLGKGLTAWKHLSVTHLQAVIGIPDKSQATILKKAEEQRWTVEQIEAEVAKVRLISRTTKAGRHRLPIFMKTLAHFAKEEELLLLDLDLASDVPDDKLEDMQQTVGRLLLNLQRVAARLEETRNARAVAQATPAPTL